MEAVIRTMLPSDWPEVRAIYEAGIASGQATFQTEAPTWEAWDAGHLTCGRLVAERAGGVEGWAALSRTSSRPAYQGVVEVSIYIAAAARGKGLGRALMQAVIDASEAAGIWTLQSSTFPENQASLALQQGAGFRIVGRRERIAQLTGQWRDTLLLERRSPLPLPGSPSVGL